MGIEPVSAALAGRFLSPGPPGRSQAFGFNYMCKIPFATEVIYSEILGFRESTGLLPKPFHHLLISSSAKKGPRTETNDK